MTTFIVPCHVQGDRIGPFLPVGLLLNLIYFLFFVKMKQSKEMVTFLATFCLNNFFTFSLNQVISSCGHIKVSKVVCSKCLGNSHSALMQIFLAIFQLRNCFGYFWPIFSNHLVTLVKLKRCHCLLGRFLPTLPMRNLPMTALSLSLFLSLSLSLPHTHTHTHTHSIYSFPIKASLSIPSCFGNWRQLQLTLRKARPFHLTK